LIRVMPVHMNNGVAFRLVRAAFDGIITPEMFPKPQRKSKRKRPHAGAN